MKKKIVLFTALLILARLQAQPKVECVDYVNPFIGTTNFGTTNPGAVAPSGMVSVVPFNVMGSSDNRFDKDERWWSTPYEFHNSFLTGFSHVNLSGVGCPDLGSILLMPTTGELQVDYRKYGSSYTDQKASPGYYSNRLTKYGIRAEMTSTARAGISRYTFPQGKAHILLNLGEGLTNESGATLRRVGDREIEGVKLLGTFCYNPQAVFPVYFVMRLDRTPQRFGYWKFQRPMKGVEAEWDKDNGNYKLYTKYSKELSGDDIGAFFSFDLEENEQIEVRIGVSYVSIANARENLDRETRQASFEKLHAATRSEWESLLSRVQIEGGTTDQRTVFYTALYHTLIHPNLLNDVNGEYPAMESDRILRTDGSRYTVFSLWDTYRNVHQLYTLLYPERQMEMIRTMLAMYREHGWLPKWELYGRETLTMEGDPSIPVIVDTWMKGLRDFDIELAYEAMRKSATLPGPQNLMRPDNDDYLSLGYVPLRAEFDNSVSHALEYYIADYSLSLLADALGKKEDAQLFRERSLNYKKYYCKEYGTLRPLLPNGSFLTPFNPKQGANFEPCPGFHEGTAWNYTFYVPHDIRGLARLMGGERAFVKKLQRVFDEELFDPTNEPDIAYPYLFAYFKGEEWRTDRQVQQVLKKFYTNSPDGLPGNDDAGTLSAWAMFSMMGFYPDCPGEPMYIFTTPTFDKITLRLDPRYYAQPELVITKEGKGSVVHKIYSKTQRLNGRRFSHQQLVGAGVLRMIMKE